MKTQVDKTNALLASIRDGKPMTLRQQLRLTVLLSVPAVIAQLSSIVMQYIDAAMVGHLGAEASASIGLVSTTTWLFWGLCVAAATGFSVQVAHRIGAGDMQGARAVLRQSLTATLVFSLLLAVLGAAISGMLPGWLGGDVSIHRDGKNLFQGDIAPDSEAGHFIAGILAHARELTCFCNPIPNSYTRFGSCEAPKYVSWSRQNRSQLVRLPSATGEFCRLELRSPDPSCNPYLVIGLILAAGLDGIEKKMPLPAPVNRNLFHKSAAEGLESLPESLREAITIAAQSDFIAKELPVPLMNKYFEYQTQLCHGYESAPDPQAWERENCFLKI